MLSSTMRRVSWTLMAVVAIAALAFGATDDRGPQSDAERVAALAGTLACPQCSGQPVNDSNAPIAEIIRAEIKQSVDAGMTDAEIRNVFVERYGEWVDLTPSRSGLTGMVWVMPFLVIGAAVGALALAFSRWKGMSRSVVSATDEDRRLVADALGGTTAGRGASTDVP
jgi:cytochrome c-type biogenesis protein CcmH